jgi:mono/diheme cytochrome c family protein
MNTPAYQTSAYGCVLRTLPVVCLLVVVGCHRDMQDQPRYEPLEASTFFADGMSSRPAVEGTVARGQLRADEAFYTGRHGEHLVARLPIEVDQEVIERGRERYGIYCSRCHGVTGKGNGIIVSRGLRRPPSFHIERLRNAPAGHFFDVMTHGFGAMPRYAVQIEPRDRWAIIAYLRALQLSQHAPLEDVPANERSKLEEARS